MEGESTSKLLFAQFNHDLNSVNGFGCTKRLIQLMLSILNQTALFVELINESKLVPLFSCACRHQRTPETRMLRGGSLPPFSSDYFRSAGLPLCGICAWAQTRPDNYQQSPGPRS